MRSGKARRGSRHTFFWILLVLLEAVLAAAVAAPAQAIQTSASSSTSTTAPAETKPKSQPSPAQAALEHAMLSVPLPGLSGFALAGPGATNGVLTPQTLGSYSSNPSEVERIYNKYSSEPGFAGWIKTWQDHDDTDQVVEIAIRFHDAAEASTNAAAFISTLSQGSSDGSESSIPSIPGAKEFTVDEPQTTSGTTIVPAQQVQAVIFSDGVYFIALHTDSLMGPGRHPIAPGTAVALSLQQYQELEQIISPANPKTPQTSRHAGASTTLIVGVGLLGAVAAVLAGVAILGSRRRKRVTTGSGTEQETARPEPVFQAPPRRRGQLRNAQKGQPPDRASKDEDLVGASTRTRVASRSEHLSGSRSRHPSAATILATTCPPESEAGWYEDPSDSQHRRIRFWDGSRWTAHVAEPEN